MKKGKSTTLGVLVSLALIMGVGMLAVMDITVPGLQAQSTLTANAGPDQTVSGANPVLVTFEGSANVPDYTCDWYNQWNLRRASNNCEPAIDVHFGKNPEVGTKRTFRLEVTDTDTGQKATDRVTITFTGSGATPPQGDPADGHTITGADHAYVQWGCEVGWQSFVVGTLEDGRWYVRSQGVGEDCMWGAAATADCIEGTHWVRMEDDVTDSEGCVSSGPEDRSLVLLVGPGGWYVADSNSGDDLVKLTPLNRNSRWIPEGSTPLP